MPGCCDNFTLIDGGDEFKAFPGLKGDDGTTFYPHVSEDGTLSWTNNGSLPNPAPVRIEGADGKSAYEAAVEGGYTGTEADFNAALAEVDTALHQSDVDSALSATSENPVQNKVIYNALQNVEIDVDSALSPTSENPVQNKVIKAALDEKAGVLIGTASGQIASFTTNDPTVDKLLGLKVSFAPVQSGSGDPTPDNVRPITGWESVSVWNQETYDPTEDPTATIQIGQIIGEPFYGGTLDVINGTLYVTQDIVDYLSFSNVSSVSGSSSYTSGYVSYTFPQGTIDSTRINSCICNSFAWNESYYNANCFYIEANGDNLVFHFTLPGAMSVQTWKMEMARISPKIIIPINPVEFSSTPVGITALHGENNVWSDAGIVTVDYAKDLNVLQEEVNGKQDAPTDVGLAGQVLGLDDDLNPVWLDQTGGGGGGTTNYNNLTNKPRINGVLLSGDKSAADLGLAAASDIPTVPVQSVNGETGAVVLDASDVGAVAEPQTAGTAGQVLGLDSNLNPTWVNQGGGGTANYNDLSNKPSIGGVTLSGNKTAADLGLAKASDIPAVPVQSVNGKTGAVVLTASDVGAKPSSYEAPVSSVNSKMGDVVLSASDVGALPSSTSIPSKTSDLTNDSGFVNAAGAASSAPVQSVNGKTGTVNLSASDVGALPSSTAIPTKTSDLTNDSGFVNAAEAAAAAPVQSVNGSTGAVTVQSTITVSGLLKGDGNGGVSAAAAGTDYQAPEAKIAITLSASWIGSGPYTQTVTVSGGTASSIISLQPSIAQSAQLIQDGVKVLQIDNNNGTFTATAIGAVPSTALTLQATRREVAT